MPNYVATRHQPVTLPVRRVKAISNKRSFFQSAALLSLSTRLSPETKLSVAVRVSDKGMYLEALLVLLVYISYNIAERLLLPQTKPADNMVC